MQTTGRIVLAPVLLIAVFYVPAQAATTFDHKIIDPSPIRTVWAKGHGDYDGDGHIDFMLAGRGTVIWYENPAGTGSTGWTRHIAYSGSNVGFEGSDSGDIDNDNHKFDNGGAEYKPGGAGHRSEKAGLAADFGL